MRRGPHRLLSVVVLTAAVWAGGEAASTAADGTETCDIAAWSTDDDPKGLNVRAGPGNGAAIIGKLPPPVEIDGDKFATEVSITGSKNGWFRISRGIVIDYIGDAPAKVAFEGAGWVSGRFLGLGLNYRNLHRAPSTDAAVVTELFDRAEGGGPDSFAVDRLHACKGRWVEVEGDFFGARHRGWTTGTCSNQVTTCP